MWYDRTVEQIRQITRWLESADEEVWPEQTTLALETLSEVERMAAPKEGRNKGTAQIVPGDPKMQRALPHIRAMVSAMQRRERQRALESGMAALREF
ncbi:MAG: hypothetical protein ABSF25_22445 [Bryobacteraceae bacterium]|jgi:hypothetical protein